MDEFLTFVAGAAVGGLLSWLITHRYYLKSGADQQEQLAKLQAALKPRNTLNDFEDLLRNSAWTKSFVGHTEIWMADADNTFQIEENLGVGSQFSLILAESVIRPRCPSGEFGG